MLTASNSIPILIICSLILSTGYIVANENNDKKTPLLNRVVSGEYPPGSVFKLVTAVLLLRDKKEKLKYECKGEHEVGISEFKKCWNPSGHGIINLEEALKFSCNVYFYKAVESVSFKDLADISKQLHFGGKVGIDLPSEKKGVIPTPGYMRKKYEHRDEFGKRIVLWATGGTKANMGIGQGDVLVTPLQIVNLINIIANKGYYYKPHLIANQEETKKISMSFGLNTEEAEGIVPPGAVGERAARRAVVAEGSEPPGAVVERAARRAVGAEGFIPPGAVLVMACIIYCRTHGPPT